MSRKRHTPEEIVTKLRQVEVLTAQGRPVAEAVRSIGVTEVTYYRWRQEYGGTAKLPEERGAKWPARKLAPSEASEAGCLPEPGLDDRSEKTVPTEGCSTEPSAREARRRRSTTH